jgi:hypothetical protein
MLNCPHARKFSMSLALAALLLLHAGSAHGGTAQKLADSRLCLWQVGTLAATCVLHAPNVRGSARTAALQACQQTMMARLQACRTRAGNSLAPTSQSAHPTSGALSDTPPSTSPAVTTDKPDYRPGDVITISGSGWQTSETVVMVLSVDPPTHPAVQLKSVADEDGNFTNKYTVQRSDAGVVFSLTATGQSSGVTAQTAAFTD